MNWEKERYQINVLRILLILLSLLTLYFTFVYFFPSFFDIMRKTLRVLSPFIAAIIGAILIDPLVDKLELQKGIKRGTAVVISLLFLLTLLVLLVVIVIYRLTTELTILYRHFPAYTQLLSEEGLSIVQKIRNFITDSPLPTEAQVALQENLQIGLLRISNLVSEATTWLFKFLTGLPSFITIVFLSGLATFFISRDKLLITSKIYQILPPKMIRPCSAIMGEISSALIGYFRGQIILLTITTVLTVVGISFLGLEYGLTIGVIAGLFDLLPVFGPGALFIPWALILIFLGEVRLGVGILMLFGIIAGTRQLMEPKILAGNLGLHPLVMIISLYLGLRLWGFWGILIGPFIVIIGKAIYRQKSQLD